MMQNHTFSLKIVLYDFYRVNKHGMESNHTLQSLVKGFEGNVFQVEEASNGPTEGGRGGYGEGYREGCGGGYQGGRNGGKTCQRRCYN
jgi:hypothetical protein